MRFIPAVSLVRIQSPLPYSERHRSRFEAFLFFSFLLLAVVVRGQHAPGLLRCEILVMRDMR